MQKSKFGSNAILNSKGHPKHSNENHKSRRSGKYNTGKVEENSDSSKKAFERRRYREKFFIYIEEKIKEEAAFVIELWDRFLESEKESFNYKMKNKKSAKASFEDFEYLKLLGNGSFGDVFLAMKTDTEMFHAVKILRKELLINKNQIVHAKCEKQVLDCIRFPFTVNLEFFFQNETCIFFVLPMVAGRDLFQYMDEVKKLKESAAKFYVSQVVLSLEYLHHLGIVYRDLKPENIVLDHKGYIKLTDFGFCKVLKGRTYTLCGTPEYMAPEILQNKGYGNSVDWWAMAVLTYELCAGITPFFSYYPNHIYNKISKGEYKKPVHFSNELTDLLGHLLEMDLTKRYGNTHHGVVHIKSHEWFDDINWKAIVNRNVVPPHIPKITNVSRLSKIKIVAEKPLLDLEEFNDLFDDFNK